MLESMGKAGPFQSVEYDVWDFFLLLLSPESLEVEVAVTMSDLDRKLQEMRMHCINQLVAARMQEAREQ